MKNFIAVLKRKPVDPSAAAPNPYLATAHGNRDSARAYQTAASHDLPIALDPEYSSLPSPRTSITSSDGSYREQRNMGQQQFQQSYQQPRMHPGNIAAQQFHQQFYGSSQDQSQQRPPQQAQWQGAIPNTTGTGPSLLDLENAQLEIAKLRSYNEAQKQEMGQEMRRLQQLRENEAVRLRNQLAKQKAEEEWRIRRVSHEAEIAKLAQMERVAAANRLVLHDERAHEIALAQHRERTSQTERIMTFVLPKVGIFILLLCVLGIFFANPLPAFIFTSVCAIVGSAVWMNKDRVDAIERRQISHERLVAEAYRANRIDLPTVERVLLTPARRDAAGLRQIEAPSSRVDEI